MTITALKIDLSGGLDDCIFLSYKFTRENELVFEIQTWDNKRLLISFKDPIFFLDWKDTEIVNFCYGPNDSPNLFQALEREYGFVPPTHPYKLLQLLNSDDVPSYEIVCTSFQIKKIGN